MSVSSNQKYAIASVLVILLSIAIDLLFLSSELSITSQNKANLRNPQAMQKTQLAPKPLTESTPNLSVAHISLPPPPASYNTQDVTQHSRVEQQVTKEVYKQASSIKVSPSLAMEKENRPVSTSQPRATSTRSSDGNLARSMKQASVKSIPSNNEVQKQYGQLGQLSSGSLRLLFPDDYYASMRILNYMHNCIGIGIGAYAGKPQQNALTLLSGKRNANAKQHKSEGDRRYSKIVRFASGMQSAKEQALLQAYAPNQQLVRLYPLWFDYALSGKIASYIGDEALSQLSGVYSLQGNRLYLENIELNEQSIKGRWQLAHNVVCGA